MGNILDGAASKLQMFLMNSDLITTWDVMKEFGLLGNKDEEEQHEETIAFF